MKKKPILEKIGKKTYEVETHEKMGADGVPETHVTYLGASGRRQIHVHGNPKPRNLMSNKDRRRLGLELDKI